MKQPNGDTAWRRPSYATLHRMVENPVYGGAYAYGKTVAATGCGVHGTGARIRRKARPEWLALKPDAHEGYVNWERFEAIRTMVSSKLANEPGIMARPSMARRCSLGSSAADAVAAS